MSAKVAAAQPDGESRVVSVRIPGKGSKVSEEVQRVISMLDVDGDGDISLSELVNIVRAKESADADNSRLRTYILGGFLLYVLTLACFFGVALGAGRLLKDAFTLSGVATDSEGRTIAQPTTMYVGEARATALLAATSEQLSAIKFLTFRLPSDQLQRLDVASFVASPDPITDSKWHSVELRSAAGTALFVDNVTAILVFPATGDRPSVAVNLTNPWMSVEMAPRPGNYAPLSSDGDSDSQGRRLQSKPTSGPSSGSNAPVNAGPPASNSSCASSMCTVSASTQGSCSANTFGCTQTDARNSNSGSSAGPGAGSLPSLSGTGTSCRT
jgi:hypothetical protein